MSVFRVEKSREFTVIANSVFKDKTLSAKAKGILVEMLSLPENWDYTLKGLTYLFSDGIDSIRQGIRELEEHGYIVRERKRDAKGRLGGMEYVIYETPRIPVNETGEPVSACPAEESPKAEIPTQAVPAEETAMTYKEINNVGICMHVLTICIFLISFGRMIEIYIVTSVAPIPMATMMNRESSHIGQNYLKSLGALGLQAFLIIICVAIYAALVQNIAVTSDISYAIWTCMGYTVLLCFSLFKTGSLSKALLGAH